MKTPRDILLAKHQATAPKLDAIRHEVVNSQFRHQGFAAVILNLLLLLWRELILPSRLIWTGLAAIWLLLLVANFSMRDRSQMTMAKSLPSQATIVAFKEQQQLLTELIGPNDPPVAEHKKPYSPQPSSQRAIEIMAA